MSSDQGQPPQKRICLVNDQIEEGSEDILDPLAYLPREIVTKIFLLLSHRVLFQKCALVSKRWNAFINSEHFFRSMKQFPSSDLPFLGQLSHLLTFHRDVTFALKSQKMQQGESRRFNVIAKFLQTITHEDKKTVHMKELFTKDGFRVFNLSKIIPYFDLAFRIPNKLCVAIRPTSGDKMAYAFHLIDEKFQLIQTLERSTNADKDIVWLVSTRLPRYVVMGANKEAAIRLVLSSERNETARKTFSDSRALSYYASSNGDIAEIANILSKKHPEIDGLCEYYGRRETPLINAAKNGNTEAVRVLLNAGAGLDRPNCDGLTPLLAAASEGRTKCVRVLLDHGADIEQSDRQGLTSLGLAAAHGHAKCAQFLLARGAKADVGEKQNQLLRRAIANGHVDCVRLLMDRGAQANSEEGNPDFLIAVRNWKLKVVELLIERGVDPTIKDKNGNNAFHCLVKGYIEKFLYFKKEKVVLALLDLLTKEGCDINSISGNDETPLIIACREGATELVKRLLDYGADANVRGPEGGTSSLLAAIQSTNRSERFFIVELLLDHGARFDLLEKSDEESSLAAVFRDADRLVPDYDPELFGLLVERGANVNVHLAPFKSREGSSDEPSLLLRSLSYRMKDEAKLLIRAGADVNLANKRGQTPLMIATKLGDAEIVDLLIKKGAQVNAVDSHGRTALMYAAGQNDVETVDVLVGNGASVNGRDNYGRTALMHAALGSSDQPLPIIREYDGNSEDDENGDESEEESESEEDEDEYEHRHYGYGYYDEEEEEEERSRSVHLSYRPKKEFVPRNFRVVKALLRNGADTALVDNSGQIGLDFVNESGKHSNARQVAALLRSLGN